MRANDITRERLRRLAGTRGGRQGAPLFLNLDPREFATPPARGTEVRSVLDRAARLVRDEDGLTHAAAPRCAPTSSASRPSSATPAATRRARTAWLCSPRAPLGLFEFLRLSRARRP